MSKVFILPLYLFWLDIEFHTENSFYPIFQGLDGTSVTSSIQSNYWEGRGPSETSILIPSPSWLSL